MQSIGLQPPGDLVLLIYMKDIQTGAYRGINQRGLNYARGENVAPPPLKLT